VGVVDELKKNQLDGLELEAVRRDRDNLSTTIIDDTFYLGFRA
jgi:hypothetical protein